MVFPGKTEDSEQKDSERLGASVFDTENTEIPAYTWKQQVSMLWTVVNTRQHTIHRY